jgi:pimeloyl-ACP methyl ester carboxylesterase
VDYVTQHLSEEIVNREALAGCVVVLSVVLVGLSTPWAQQAPTPPRSEEERWDRLFTAEPPHIRWQPNQFLMDVTAPGITVPVLQVHAPQDWLVPLDAARALFARFPGRKVMLELPGGHNDVGFRDESLSRTLAQFWSNPR